MSHVIAAFSDIHANRHAAAAVLADIRRQAPDQIVCLGDLVGYGAFPNEVIEIVRDAGIPTLAGNYDDGVGFDRDECGCAYTDPADIAGRPLAPLDQGPGDAREQGLAALPAP